MKKQLHQFPALLWLLLFPVYLSGQNLEIKDVTAFTTTFISECGDSDTLSVALINCCSADPLTNVIAAIELPPYIEYTGYVNDACVNSVNGNDITMPIFDLIDVGYLDTVDFDFMVRAKCGANAESTLIPNITVDYSTPAGNFSENGSLSDITTYVKKPSLQLVGTENLLQANGVVGQTFTRSYEISNTGILSELLEFDFESTIEANTELVSLSVDGTIVSPDISGNTVSYTVSTLLRNLDEYPDDVVTITETILVNACTDPNVGSTTTARWGCDGGTCEEESIFPNTQTPTGSPAISADIALHNTPVCWDDEATAVITLTNTGDGTAKDVTYTIDNRYGTYNQNYIIESSFQYQQGSGSLQSLALSSVSDPYSGPPCYSGGSLNSKLTFVIDYIQPGETYYVYFDYVKCVLDNSNCGGNNLFEYWYTTGQFDGTCNFPTTSIAQDYLNQEQIYWAGSITDSPVELRDTEVGNFELFYSAALLRDYEDDGSGYVLVEIDIPNGFCLSSSNTYDFLSAYTVTEATTSQNFDSNTGILSLKYPARDYGYNKRIEFDLEGCCSAPGASGGWKDIIVNTYFVPSANCSPLPRHQVVCTMSIPIRLKCPSPCVEGGIAFESFEALRTTFGEPDDNDDGQPSGSTLDMSKVRRDRIMIDDRFQTVHKGHVFIGQTPYPQSFSYGYASVNIPTMGQMIDFEDASVYIYDVSTGNSYTCNDLRSSVSSTGNSQTVLVDYSIPILLSDACSGLPSDFVFENGDSIHVFTNFHLNTAFSDFILETFNTEFYLQDSDDFNGNQYYCNNFTDRILALGYKISNLGNYNRDFDNCGPENVDEIYNYLTFGTNNSSGSSYFPYEYRKVMTVNEVTVDAPPGYTIEGLQIREVINTGNYTGSSITKTISPSSVSGSTYTFDIRAAYDSGFPEPDDGSRFMISPSVSVDCQAVDASAPISIEYQTHFLTDETITKNGSINYEIDRANIQIQMIDAPTQEAFEKVETFDLVVKNNSSVSDAPYVYFAYTPNAYISVDSIYNVTDGHYLAKNSDFWEIGALSKGGDNVRLRLYVSYNNCNLQSFDITAGFECEGYPSSTSGITCTPFNSTLYLDPVYPELQVAVVDKQVVYSDLCETVDYTISVSNRDPGVAYDMLFDINFPPGANIELVSGYSKVSYQGQEIFIEPSQLSATQYQWDISALYAQLQSNGLRPYAERPDNEYLVSIRLASDCGYVSGSTIKFASNAKTACGSSLRQANDATFPIILNSAANLLQVYVPFITQDTSNRSSFNFQMINKSPTGSYATSANDVFSLIVPDGYSYSPNTSSFSKYEPSNIEPTERQVDGFTLLEWELADDIPFNDTMIWTAEFTVDSLVVGCDISTFNVRTITSLEDVCIATGQNCMVSAISKEDDFYFSQCQGSGSGKMAGLESNGDLSTKIAGRNWKAQQNPSQYLTTRAALNKFRQQAVASGQIRANSLFKSGSSNILDFIPERATFQTQAYVSTPEDLINITNAVEVFSVDYFRNDQRFGAILATTTLDRVYEHTKAVCDRLSGAVLEDLNHISIADHPFIVYTLKQTTTTEYGISFSVYLKDGEYVIDNQWINERYEKHPTIFNFQVWANSQDLTKDLVQRIINMLGQQGTVAFKNKNTPQFPEVFVKYGEYQNGALQLFIQNNNQAEELKLWGSYKATETSDSEPFSETIALSGAANEWITVPTGAIYDIGMSLRNGLSTNVDVIYAADGTWFLDYPKSEAQIINYEIAPDQQEALDDEEQYFVERSVHLSGTVKSYVSVVRNLRSRERTVDLSTFNELRFQAQADQNRRVKVTLVKKNGTGGVEHYSRSIQLSPTLNDYQIPLSHFLNNSDEVLSSNDIQSVVFTVYGNGEHFEPVHLDLSNISFGTNEELLDISLTDENAVLAIPNPLEKQTTLFFNLSEENSPVLLQIYDTQGTIIHSEIKYFYKGQNKWLMNCNDFPAGSYYYVLTSDYNRRSGKIVVAR